MNGKMTAQDAKKAKIIIVMPAYNAEKTLKQTCSLIPCDSFDEIILVDDASVDKTIEIAKELKLKTIAHTKNKGYGANQKTCYKQALNDGADIIVMLHPDNQYDPRLIPNLTLPILEGQADVVFGSRMLYDPILGGPLQGKMPRYKFICNKFLTLIENLVLGTYFSEFHTGYRAFSRKALESINYDLNSDGFIFDNEIIIQLFLKKVRFKEIPTITKYFSDASSTSFRQSLVYGFGIIKTMFKYLLHVNKIKKYKQFL
ncbi:MAG: glycosyltransferase family 2 protein [Candidatus Omnitrophica bacterium]|nr:glycosyltransferase family 2 protein [Candidatus Omnitrophota bacterium]